MQRKWKRFLCLVLCLAMVMPMVPQIRVQAAETADPAVQAPAQMETRPLEEERLLAKEKLLQSDVVEISTREEFLAIMGNDYESYRTYRLTEDIDLGEIVPLGYDPETGTTTPFSGTLDGNGHTISYSMKEVPGCTDYGLFSAAIHFYADDLSLNVDMDLSLSAADTYCVGALVGSQDYEQAYGEFYEIAVSGAMQVKSTADGGSLTVGILTAAEDAIYIQSCEVDMDINIDAAETVALHYYNIGSNSASCILKGDVSVSGYLEDFWLLHLASNSICTQDLVLNYKGGDSYETCGIDMHGYNNLLSGDYKITDTNSSSWHQFYIMLRSDSSEFSGSVSVVSQNSSLGFNGAADSTNVILDVDMDFQNIKNTYYSSGKFEGLHECQESVLSGDISLSGTRFFASSEGESNQVLANISGADNNEFYVLYKETDSLYEGNIQIHGVEGLSAVMLSECTRCTFSGSADFKDEGSNRTSNIRIAQNGTENLVMADIAFTDPTKIVYDYGNGITQHYIGDVLYVLSGETGSYFTGSVNSVHHVVVVDGTDCYADADVSAYECFLFSPTAKNSYFSGNVQCEQFTPFALTAANCFAEANVKVNSNYGVTYYGYLSYLDENLSSRYTINTEGVNCNFTGHMDLTSSAKVVINSTFPVQIHHGIVGEFSSSNIPTGSDEWDGIGYHMERNCTYGCPYLIGPGSSVEKPGHYATAIVVLRPGEDANSSSAADGWDGSIDPVDKTYQPDADNASYIFRVVTPDEKPLSGGSLVFNGLRYFLNDGGVVTVKNGPGVITPLVVSSAEGKELKVYDCYRPIPDAINTLRVGDELELELDLVAEGGTAAEDAEATGAEVEVAGVKYPLVMMALSSDLDLQAGDLNIASNFNEDTKRYEVIFSTEHLETSRADSWKDTWKEYSRTLQKGNFTQEPSEKKIKLLGMECDVSLTAVMEFEYDSSTGGFKIVSGTGRLKFGGDARETNPFIVPVVYWTVSGGAEIEGTVGVNSTYDEAVKAAVVRFIGAIDLQGSVEGALGTGARAANIYWEVGLSGTLAGGVQFPWVSLRDSAEVKLTADAFTEARAWVLGGRRQYTFVDVQLWPRPAKGMATLSIPQNTEMKILPRNYANQAVTLAGDSTGGFASVVDDTRADYPYSYLRLERLSDGRYLLVYTDDDTSRASADRSVLRAVIGTVDSSTNAISWGESIAIDGDGTGDYSMDVSVSGTEAALIWQDMDKTFGDGSGLTTGEMADHVDLSRAILDCSGEVPVVTENITVTSGNSLCEEHAVICHWGSETRTAWVTSTVNDPMVSQDSEVYTLWLNGEMVAETQQEISGIVLLEEELLWSTQTDNGSDLWMQDADGTVTQLRTEGIKDLQSRGEYFCFTEGTSLYWGKGSCDTLTEIDRNESYTNTVRVSDDGQVYFLDNRTDSARLYAFRNGAVRPVADFDGFVSCWDVSGGQVAALIKHGFATEDASDDAAYMRSLAEQTIVDIQVGEIYCDNTAAAPGSQVTMSAKVFNNGTNDLGEISFSVAGSGGTALTSGNLYVDIPTGESAVEAFSFTVPEDFTSQDVTVTIADTVQTIRLGRSNLKVEAIWKEYRPEQLQVTVSNTGLGEATGTVTVSDGEQTLLTQTVTVAQGEQQQLEVAFDHYYTDPTTIFAALTETEDSAVSYDNEDSVVVTYGPMEAGVLVFESMVLGAGDTVPIRYRTVPANAAVPVLSYQVDRPDVVSVDAQGNLTALKIGTATVTAITDKGKTFDFTVTVADFFPLKESRTLTLQSWESVTYIFEPEESGNYELYTNDTNSALYFYIISPDGSRSTTVTSGTHRGEVLAMKAGERYTIQVSNYSSEQTTGTFLLDAYSGTIPEHSYTPQITAPTCTENGYTTYICSHCGDSYVGDYRDALDHSWGQWQTIQEATADTDGEEMRQCSRCQEQEKQSIPATGTKPEKMENPFVDVFEADYYYAPVLWAVNKGITNGMDATHFVPDGTCTRAQIVTFLWRANGSPAPATSNNPFTDVPAGQWYTDAVLWAVGEGITTGTSATTFSPDAGCTRGQVATFLWRSEKQPAVSGENIFTDIAPGAYYYDAVLWAVANGITNGMGDGTFAPDATCTRGQIVTFLYRAMT